MPVVGTPVTPVVPGVGITANDVRLFLRDYSSNNILLNNVQFTDNEMNTAINFALDEYNTIPPITSDQNGAIPNSLLMLGAAAWLMNSESFLQIRNQATYVDGDIAPIGIDDKQAFYRDFVKQLKDDWKTAAQKYKISKNMESAYGYLSSGYRNVARFLP